jgi:hypothetical protein
MNVNFELFKSLLEGSTIRVTEATRAVLLSLCREFGNSDISLSILNHFHSYYPLNQICDSFGDISIPFLALVFHRLTSSELDNIPVSVRYDILSHFLSDAEYYSLLQFVRFEYLSLECISDFVSMTPDYIDHRLWEAISRRLISPYCEIDFPLQEAKSLGIEFMLQQPGSLDGIISHLTRKHDRNVHDKGIVTVTSKSVWRNGPLFAVRNVVDFSSYMYFSSNDSPGQWICWDFHEKRIHLTHYTIKTTVLKSWVVEGSLDAEAWREIDRKTGNNDLQAGSRMASWQIF